MQIQMTIQSVHGDEISPGILRSIRSISEKIGEVNANHLSKQSPQLRKQNRIKTIHSSLQIEGNTLTEEQITALLDNKRVVGPPKDVTEVLNAIQVYEKLNSYDCISEKSFLSAHRQLMTGLISEPGKYRKQGVGIVKGKKLEFYQQRESHYFYPGVYCLDCCKN